VDIKQGGFMDYTISDNKVIQTTTTEINLDQVNNEIMMLTQQIASMQSRVDDLKAFLAKDDVAAVAATQESAKQAAIKALADAQAEAQKMRI